MDDASKEQLNRFLDNLNTAVEKGAEFTMEQAPLVAQEMVAFGRAYYTVVIVASMAACCVGVVSLYRHGHKWVKTAEDTTEGATFAGAFTKVLAAPFAILIGTLCAMVNLSVFLKVWFAPRLYVIEEIARLLK